SPCPYGWEVGGGKCLAPVDYQGLCENPTVFTADLAAKQEWALSCTAAFCRPICPVGMRESYSVSCPYGWRLRDDVPGCHAPPSYIGTCNSPSSFDGDDDSKKAWALSCNAIFCKPVCPGEMITGYSAPCPYGWEEGGDHCDVTSIDSIYAGICDSIPSFGGGDENSKMTWSQNCDVVFCKERVCPPGTADDYSRPCPYEWELRPDHTGTLKCFAPSSYDGNNGQCGASHGPSRWRAAETKDWAIRCGVAYCRNLFCPYGTIEDYSQSCPYGWGVSGSTCYPPSSYDGVCNGGSTFIGYSPKQKDQWGQTGCDAGFCRLPVCLCPPGTITDYHQPCPYGWFGGAGADGSGNAFCGNQDFSESIVFRTTCVDGEYLGLECISFDDKTSWAEEHQIAFCRPRDCLPETPEVPETPDPLASGCPPGTFEDYSQPCPYGWEQVSGMPLGMQRCINPAEAPVCGGATFYESCPPGLPCTTYADKPLWGESCSALFCIEVDDLIRSTWPHPTPSVPLPTDGDDAGVGEERGERWIGYAAMAERHNQWVARRACNGEVTAFQTRCEQESIISLEDLAAGWQPQIDMLVIPNEEQGTFTVFTGCLIPEWRHTPERMQIPRRSARSTPAGEPLPFFSVSPELSFTNTKVGVQLRPNNGGLDHIMCSCRYDNDEIERFQQAGINALLLDPITTRSCGFWQHNIACDAGDAEMLCLNDGRRQPCSCTKSCGLLFPQEPHSPNPWSDNLPGLRQHCVAETCGYYEPLGAEPTCIPGAHRSFGTLFGASPFAALTTPSALTDHPGASSDLTQAALTAAGYTHRALVYIHLEDAGFDDWRGDNRHNRRYGRQLCDGEVRGFRTVCRGQSPLTSATPNADRELAADTVIGTTADPGPDGTRVWARFTECLWMTWHFNHTSTVELPLDQAHNTYKVHWKSASRAKIAVANGYVYLSDSASGSGSEPVVDDQVVSCMCQVEPEQLQMCPSVGWLPGMDPTNEYSTNNGDVIQGLRGEDYHSVCGWWTEPQRPGDKFDVSDVKRLCGADAEDGLITCGPDPFAVLALGQDPAGMCSAGAFCEATACRCALTHTEATQQGLSMSNSHEFVEFQPPGASLRYLHWVAGPAGCGTRFVMTACERQVYCGPMTHQGYFVCAPGQRKQGLVATESCRAECECVDGAFDRQGGRCNAYHRPASDDDVRAACGPYTLRSTDETEAPLVYECVYRVDAVGFGDLVNALYETPVVANAERVDPLPYADVPTCTFDRRTCACEDETADTDVPYPPCTTPKQPQIFPCSEADITEVCDGGGLVSGCSKSCTDATMTSCTVTCECVGATTILGQCIPDGRACGGVWTATKDSEAVKLCGSMMAPAALWPVIRPTILDQELHYGDAYNGADEGVDAHSLTDVCWIKSETIVHCVCQTSNEATFASEDIIYTIEHAAIVGDGIPAAPTLTLCGDADEFGRNIRVLAQTAEHYLVARAKDNAELEGRTGFVVAGHSIQGGDSTASEHGAFADATGHKWFGTTGVVVVASLRYFCEPFMTGTCHGLTSKEGNPKNANDLDFTELSYGPGGSYADEFCRQWASHYKDILQHYTWENARFRNGAKTRNWEKVAATSGTDDGVVYTYQKTGLEFEERVLNNEFNLPDPFFFHGATETLYANTLQNVKHWRKGCSIMSGYCPTDSHEGIDGGYWEEEPQGTGYNDAMAWCGRGPPGRYTKKRERWWQWTPRPPPTDPSGEQSADATTETARDWCVESTDASHLDPKYTGRCLMHGLNSNKTDRGGAYNALAWAIHPWHHTDPSQGGRYEDRYDRKTVALNVSINRATCWSMARCSGYKDDCDFSRYVQVTLNGDWIRYPGWHRSWSEDGDYEFNCFMSTNDPLGHWADNAPVVQEVGIAKENKPKKKPV
ncbi:MAG: hypothetical protein GY703_12135, partial [Gammaproteobacteria bacterium]|nr:hypothetical protein [Gammaproteobacteria bacterium]